MIKKTNLPNPIAHSADSSPNAKTPGSPRITGRWRTALRLIVAAALALGVANTASAATPFPMSSGNYSENFSDIANWTNDFGSGIGAANWASVGIIGSGNSVTTGTRTTKSSAAFVTGSGGGIQRGTQALVFLSTGSTATPEAVAVDLLLDFTGRNAGTLSFSWVGLDNSSGTRPTSLRIFWSTDGTTFTEITAAQVIDIQSPTTGSITAVALPAAFNNSPTARLRFYNHAGTITGSGNRDKISIDDLAITSTGPAITGAATAAPFTTTYGTPSTAQLFTVGGTNMTADLVATATGGYEVSSDGTTYSNTATFTQSSGTASGSLSIRLKATAPVAGSYNAQAIVLSTTGASSVNITTSASGNTVTPAALTITGVTAENKVYDRTNAATLSGTATYVGLVNGESFSVTGAPVATFVDALVGTGKAVSVSGYTAPTNYTVTQPSGLMANITAKALTVDNAAVVTKPYDGTASATITGDLVGIIAPDVVTLVGTGTFASVDPGTGIAVTSTSTLSGADAANYSLTQPMGLTGTILPANSPTIDVSVTSLTGVSTTYGTPSVTRTFTTSGAYLSGDLTVTAPAGFEVSSNGTTFGSSVILTASSGIVSETTIFVRLAATTAANSYAGNVLVSGGGATQRTVSIGSSTVSPKTLTITGLAAESKVYDRTTSATFTGTPAYAGLENGESFAVSGTGSASFGTATAGTAKPVTVTGYVAPSANYTLPDPILSADITPVALTVTGAVVTTKPYDGTTVATITGATLVGVLSPDVVTVGGGGTFADANAGTGIAVTANLTLGGADAGNYSVVQPIGLTGTITKLDQIITFAALAGKATSDAPFTLTATSSSGLTVTFASDNLAVATVLGDTVTITGGGAAIITASQAGDLNYNAALDVPRTLTVSTAAWPGPWSGIAASPFEATIKDTNVASAQLARVGLTGVSSAARYSSSGWNTSVNYLTATLTATAGHSINLNGAALAGTWGSSSTGPGSYDVRSSVDGYATSIGTFASIGSGTVFTAITLPASGYNGLSSITFRFIGSTTSAGGGTTSAAGTGGPATLTVGGALVVSPTITASAGPNGSIAPSGATNVPLGGSQAYTITPDVGYHILDVLVDGASVGAVASYTFTNVTTAHTISASFAINNYTVAYSGNGNTGGSAPVDANSPYPFGSTVTVLGPGTFVKTDYTFVEWNTSPDGSGTGYTPGSTFTIGANTTLYAQWMASPEITVSGTLSALSTTYGTASSATSFTASGTALSGDLTVSAPVGFEVSSDGTTYGATATLSESGGTVASTPIFVRLAATTAVGSTFGDVTVSGGGATPKTVAVPSSTVSAKALSIVGLVGVDKTYDRTTAGSVSGTATLSGIANGDDVSVTGSPTVTFATAIVGEDKALTVSGYTLAGPALGNYTLTQPAGLTADITPKALTVSGAAVTPKSFDGNTTATITGTLVGVIAPDVVTFVGTGTFASAGPGTGIAVTSTSTLSGADAGNYALTQPVGLTGNITSGTGGVFSFAAAPLLSVTPKSADGTGAANVVHVVINRGSTTGGVATFKLAAIDPGSVPTGYVKLLNGTTGTFDFTFTGSQTITFGDGEATKTVDIPLSATVRKGQFALMASNLSSGITFPSPSLRVQVELKDTAAPTLTVALSGEDSPAGSGKTTGATSAGSVSLTGAVADPAATPTSAQSGLHRLEVTVKNVSLPALGTTTTYGVGSDGGTAALSGGIPIALEEGVNTIVVTAFDKAGNKTAKTITRKFINTDLNAFAGTYTGLLVPNGTAGTAAVGHDNSGFVTLTVSSAAAVSGKLTVGGVAVSFTGTLINGGGVRFKGTNQLAVDVIDKTEFESYLGALEGLAVDGTLATGSLNDSAGGASLGSFTAKKQIVSSQTVPGALVGKYTVAIPAPQSPSPLASVATFPQGDGYASVSIATNGSVSVAGKLADGTTIAGSSKLHGASLTEAPLFFLLYKKNGSFATKLTFDLSAATHADSDVLGTNTLWVRPHLPRSRYYKAGWATGAALDVVGAHFTVPTTASILPDIVTGTAPAANVQVQLADGNLGGSALGGSATRSLRIANVGATAMALNKVTKPPTETDLGLTLSLNTGTGVFSGKFTHSDGSVIAYQGVILQKGAVGTGPNRKGFGYFLSTAPASYSGSGQSGGVTLTP